MKTTPYFYKVIVRLEDDEIYTEKQHHIWKKAQVTFTTLAQIPKFNLSKI